MSKENRQKIEALIETGAINNLELARTIAFHNDVNFAKFFDKHFNKIKQVVSQSLVETREVISTLRLLNKDLRQHAIASIEFKLISEKIKRLKKRLSAHYEKEKKYIKIRDNLEEFRLKFFVFDEKGMWRLDFYKDLK